MESSATFVPLFLANNKIAENKQMDVRKKKNRKQRITSIIKPAPDRGEDDSTKISWFRTNKCLKVGKLSIITLCTINSRNALTPLAQREYDAIGAL